MAEKRHTSPFASSCFPVLPKLLGCESKHVIDLVFLFKNVSFSLGTFQLWNWTGKPIFRSLDSCNKNLMRFLKSFERADSWFWRHTWQPDKIVRCQNKSGVCWHLGKLYSLFPRHKRRWSEFLAFLRLATIHATPVDLHFEHFYHKLEMERHPSED